MRDRGRDSEIVALGWAILPVTFDMLVSQPGTFAQTVARALRARGVAC